MGSSGFLTASLRGMCVALCAGWLAAGSVLAQTSSVGPNLLDQASQAVGVVQCQPAIARMAALTLVGSRAHDVLIDWDREAPNKGPFFSMIGMVFGNGAAFASVNAVPKPNGECAISAERFSAAPFTCNSVAQVELDSYRPTQLMPGFTVYTSIDDPNSTVVLMDSVPNCLVLRRYVQFDWKPPQDSPRPLSTGVRQ